MSSDSRTGSVWAVAIVFLILTWLTVVMRVFVRIEQLGRFGLDDKFVCIGQIFFTGYLICQMAGAAFGTGQHISDLDLGNAEIALRFWFFCEIWYSLATICVKVAICLSLRRVVVRRSHLWVIYGLIIWSVAVGLAFFLGIIFQCTPTSNWWDLDPANKHCLPVDTVISLIYAMSACNVACDWTLGIFPFFIVKDLSIPAYQKILVASILAFGALASTATIVRMVYIPTLKQTYLGWDGDFLYDTTPIAVWSTVEVGVAITAICLATLRPLINKVLWHMGLSSQSSHGYGSRSNEDETRSPHGVAPYDKDFELSQGYFSHAPRQNTSRPPGPCRFAEETDFRRFLKAEESTKIATQVNATRPLSISLSENGDGSIHPREAFKRHHPP